MVDQLLLPLLGEEWISIVATAIIEYIRQMVATDWEHFESSISTLDGTSDQFIGQSRVSVIITSYLIQQCSAFDMVSFQSYCCCFIEHFQSYPKHYLSLLQYQNFTVTVAIVIVAAIAIVDFTSNPYLCHSEELLDQQVQKYSSFKGMEHLFQCSHFTG